MIDISHDKNKDKIITGGTGKMNENETYIKDIRIYQAVSKLSHPIADSTHDISKIAFYVRSGISFKLPLQPERN